MRFVSNVHTHTNWCDGANSSWEMAEEALRLGFSDLGFSSHTQEIGHPGYGMDVGEEDAYRAEIAEVKATYAGRLNILCGAERDTYSPSSGLGFDYIIGSNHYLPPRDSEFQAVDLSAKELNALVTTWYDGNWKDMIRDFYADSVRNIQSNKPTIVGHFDLIKKYNAGNIVFDENTTFYQNTALEALDEVSKVVRSYGGMVEMNMSVLARGFREDPYPAPFLLKHLAQTTTRVIVTGDSHNVRALNNGFEQAPAFLQEAGFKQVAMLCDGVFQDIPFEA